MKKRLLLLFAPLVAFAAPLEAPDYELVIPRHVLVQRLAIEEQYVSTFLHGANPVGQAYFEGRASVYRELITLGDTLTKK